MKEIDGMLKIFNSSCLDVILPRWIGDLAPLTLTIMRNPAIILMLCKRENLAFFHVFGKN